EDARLDLLGNAGPSRSLARVREPLARIVLHLRKTTHRHVERVANAREREVGALVGRGDAEEVLVGAVLAQHPLAAVVASQLVVDRAGPGPWQLDEDVPVLVADDHVPMLADRSGRSVRSRLPGLAVGSRARVRARLGEGSLSR